MWGSDVQEPRGPITRLAAMARRPGISLLACVFAVAIGGCGSSSGNSDAIPSGDATQLLDLLASMQSQIDQGDCTHLTGTAQEFASVVAQLPSTVPGDVSSALNKQAESLDQLTADPSQCTPTGATGAAGASTSTSTTTTDAVTTSSSTTTDETTSTAPEQQAPQHDPNQTPPAGNQGTGPPGGTPPGQSGGDGGSTDTGGVTPGGKGPSK
jgi:hypothetical protein